jgi:AraC family transcriptional regulator
MKWKRLRKKPVSIARAPSGNFSTVPRKSTKTACVAAAVAYGQNLESFVAGTIPKRKYVVAHFSGSPAIGPWKVYPAIMEYLEVHRLSGEGSSIEIYTINGDAIETEYLYPLK